MNELTDEHINKLNCIWFESDDNVDSYCIANDSVLAFARAVIAADRAQRQAGQEPDAWLSWSRSGGVPISVSLDAKDKDRWLREGVQVFALYAAPKP